MARLEDLHFSGESLPDEGEDQARLAAQCLTDIDEMRALGGYDWASDTLDSIYDQASRTGRVTPWQVQAVQNIRAGGEQQSERRPRRWGRRR